MHFAYYETIVFQPLTLIFSRSDVRDLEADSVLEFARHRGRRRMGAFHPGHSAAETHPEKRPTLQEQCYGIRGGPTQLSKCIQVLEWHHR